MGNTRLGEKIILVGIIGMIVSFYVVLYGEFARTAQLFGSGIIGLSISFILLVVAFIIMGREVNNG